MAYKILTHTEDSVTVALYASDSEYYAHATIHPVYQFDGMEWRPEWEYATIAEAVERSFAIVRSLAAAPSQRLDWCKARRGDLTVKR